MKTRFLLIFSILLSLYTYSTNWITLGPDTANISRIEFGVAIQCHVLCADNGFYLYNYGSNTCEFFTNGGLPVSGAAYLDQDRFLVAMGNGSWSDGIYAFNINTHYFEVMEWIVWPNFLHYHEANQTYWVGSDWGNMLKSSDGANWENDIFFTAKPCIGIASYGENMVVSAISDLTNIYWSTNNGDTWNPSALSPLFPEFAFHYQGLLLGVFPGYSNSSGIWKSEDYGNSWEVLFYQDNLSTVAFDVFSEIFVGFDGEGIAHYNPQYGLVFLNEGLPDLHINKIQVNPSMSAPAIFVSTDEGAFYSYDYYVAVGDLEGKNQEFSIFPNPATEVIYFENPEKVLKVDFLNLSGQLIKSEVTNGQSKSVSTSSLPSGVYFLKAYCNDSEYLSKVVIR